MPSIEVLFFGRLRAATSTRSWHHSVEPNATARHVYAAACAQFGNLSGADAGVRVAVNEDYAKWDTPVGDHDVVAFIPPVAGGSSDVTVMLTDRPIDVFALVEAARSDRDGALCTFTGHVRDSTDGDPVAGLEYSAYESMAVKHMRAAAEQLRAAHGAHAVAIAHRLGPVAVGEVSIAVTVAAAHRAAAFAVCHELVDAIKAGAPIFKLEHRPSGARWIEACS